MFNAEDGLGGLFGDAFPHGEERAAAFSFVFCAGVFLSIADEADALSEVSHEVEVFFPCCIDEFEQDGAFGLSEFGSEELVDSLKDFGADFFDGESADGVGVESESEFLFDPVQECGGLGIGGASFGFAAGEYLVEFVFDGGGIGASGEEFAGGGEESFADGM